ncbi:MAG: UDP-N-acetyl-D-mannosamine dehydrogenase [Candidatus Sumerlaeaceae bacterium]|nr:UDP-N-acetyl-D-mannosamine dehydrogenase [Candidatus Sumerlaeaceae bacterium]
MSADGVRPVASVSVHPTRREVCVLGLGYIGLPTAAILASRGHRVYGVDVNETVVRTINEGRIHIVEPDLDIMVRSAVETGRLSASTAPSPAEVFMICVPTPVNHATCAPDLTFVEAAARSIPPVLRQGNLVILESTSPPGTTIRVVGGVLREAGFQPGRDVHLAYCPERVLPGAILRECVENERVIGGYTPDCATAARDFYRTFVQGEIHLSDCTTAEIVKLAENASRDVQIAFANELSLIARRHGVSVWEVIRLANRHPRVNILQPGPGVGGHCIAVDPWFLISDTPREDPSVMRAARELNDAMPVRCARLVASTARECGAKTVALLGMAYKADIDDCRESPSLAVLETLRREAPDLEILCCEPNVSALDGVVLTPLAECLSRAQLAVILVAHREFRDLAANPPPNMNFVDFKGVLSDR